MKNAQAFISFLFVFSGIVWLGLLAPIDTPEWKIILGGVFVILGWFIGACPRDDA